MSTKIPYVQETVNICVGCQNTSSPGCLNCYAAGTALSLKRQGVPQYQHVVTERGWNGDVEFVRHAVLKPFKWSEPRTILVNSMGDTFNPVSVKQLSMTHVAVAGDIDITFAMAYLCPRHTFFILTKRAQCMRQYSTQYNICNRLRLGCKEILENMIAQSKMGKKHWELIGQHDSQFVEWPIKNVFMGTTICTQKELYDKFWQLGFVNAHRRWISFEPLLEPIDFLQSNVMWTPAMGGLGPASLIHWGVIGCESGKNRRPIANKHILSLAKQLQAMGIPAYIKQIEVDGKVSKNPDEWPDEYKIQEYPKGAV